MRRALSRRMPLVTFSVAARGAATALRAAGGLASAAAGLLDGAGQVLDGVAEVVDPPERSQARNVSYAAAATPSSVSDPPPREEAPQRASAPAPASTPAAPQRPPSRRPRTDRPSDRRTAEEMATGRVNGTPPAGSEPPVAEPEHVDEGRELVAEFADAGAEEGAGATVRVEEPWPGYARMPAGAIVEQLAAVDDSTVALVELYEQMHRHRRTVRDAAAREMRRRADRPRPHP